MRFLLPIFACVALCANAQTATDTAARIHSIFQRYTGAGPGSQLAITRGNRPLFSGAWGLAELEHGAPMTVETRIEAGSVAKQFTAAAILLLAHQGKLSLNDDVRRYLPELRNYGQTIRVRHLVHQTSGIKDWQAVADLTGWGSGARTYTNDQALAIAARQTTLNNEPGAEFLYSNSNYILLAVIVARVSGMSFAEYTKRYLFAPAGMTHTVWRDNFRSVVPGRAVAYSFGDGGYESDMPFESTHGDGGLLTTAGDLLKWNQFYSSGSLAGGSVLRQQIAYDTLNNGRINYYGAGVFIQRSGGHRVIRHTGGTGGYRCYLAWYPDLQLSVAWLSNTSRWDSSDLDAVYAVEQLFLPPGAATGSQMSQAETHSSAPHTARGLEGWYRNRRSLYGIQILADGGKYWAVQRDERIPIEPTTSGFRMGSNQLIMDGKMLRYVDSDKDTTVYEATAPADPRVALPRFAGKYSSDEAQCGVLIFVKNDTLLLQLENGATYRLKPTYRDAFRILDFGGVLNFDRRTNGTISGLRIGQGRARNVYFSRQR